MLRACLLFIGVVMFASSASTDASTPPITLVESNSSVSQPPMYQSFYTRPTGLEMMGPYGISSDAGRTWTPFTPSPDYSAGLPYGYRRDMFPSVVDPVSGRLVTLYNSLDTHGLDPNEVEPPIAEKEYYLRYSVSTTYGRTKLFNETVVQQGHIESNAFDGVYVGQNGIYLGDIGSMPIFTRSGNILVSAQVGVLDAGGNLTSPGGGMTYTDVIPMVGTWGDDNRLIWNVSDRVVADPARSTRGMIEPTMAEMPDGRILMVMRGSNGGTRDPNFQISSYRWYSISSDGGHTWTDPVPWTYDSGQAFFSPSSMSSLITMSSGRVFWVGNINQTNSHGNDDRWPLVLGEVDPATLTLRKSSLVTVDTRGPDDPGGPSLLNISHVRAIEDRMTGDLMLVVIRTTDQYQTIGWNTYRYHVVPEPSALGVLAGAAIICGRRRLV